MITATLEKTVTQDLSHEEKLELIKKIAESMQVTKGQKRESLAGQFDLSGITDQDLEDAKKIWR